MTGVQKKVILVFSILFVIAVFVLIGYLVFNVKNITTSSTVERIALDDEIAKDLSLEETELAVRSSGIKKGQLIFSISEEKVKENIENQISTVKVLKVETIFPNSVQIHLTKRKPVAYLSLTDSPSELVTIDEDLKVVKTIDKVKLNNRLIEIKGFSIKKSDAIQGNVLDAKAAINAKALFETIRTFFAKDNVATKEIEGLNFSRSKFTFFLDNIDVSDDKFVIVNLKSGMSIYLNVNTKTDMSTQLSKACLIYINYKNYAKVAENNSLSGMKLYNNIDYSFDEYSIDATNKYIIFDTKMNSWTIKTK